MAGGFIESHGESIYYEIWGDSGDAVVFCHGMGGSHAVWYQQVAHFATTHRVVTWDQRGFGRSTRVTGDLGPGPAVGDLTRLLDHLAIGRAHVIGQSMGGWAALGLAVTNPERVLSLVLADTTGGILTPEIADALEAVGAAVVTGPPPGELPLGSHPAVGTQLANDDLAHSFLYGQLGSLTDPPAPQAIVPLLQASDHTRAAARLAKPTLFVVGEGDPIFPPSLIATAAALIPGSRVEVVGRTGHSPYFERPEAWNDIVERFLADSGGGQRSSN